MRKRGSVVGVFVCVLAACGGSKEGGDGGDADASTAECTINDECKQEGDFCVIRFCDQGVCVVENDNDGEQCDDGDLCTTGDVCVDGVCEADPTNCDGVSDACNDGVCDVATGECVGEPRANGTACDDALFCTEADACDAGACVGTVRDCSAEDSACTQGLCNEDLAACEALPINEGGTCDDGLFCTAGETCTAGVCDGPATDCSGATDQCNAGVCDETADACVGDPLTDGTPCDDGAFCTPTDQCITGTCTGSGTVDCTVLDNQCNVGVCDDGADSCVTAPANEGATCDDGLFCTETETCTSGVCGGGSAFSCDDMDTCTTDTCDDVLNACVNTLTPVPGAEGPPGDATCSDGIDNDCDGDDDLADANCVGCTGAGDCDDGNDCTSDVCNGSAVCENTPLTGTGCDDELFCTTGDVCTAGVCGGATRDCTAADNDCNVGTCDETGNACVPQPANEGGSCADGLFCTVGDTCTAGTCSGAPRDCSGSGGPCLTGACDEGGGACVGTPVANGTACDISFCQIDGSCTAGACGGTVARNCGDGDACTSDSCDDVADVCENTALELDPSSPVFTSATGASLNVCLTADSGAQIVVWTDLVDTLGGPVSGATVSIGGFTATESTTRAGTYYIELIAAAAPTSETLSISATGCGDTEVLTSTVTVDHIAANTTLGGTGGCSPMGGNLRVRALDAAGAPLADVRVLVGDGEGDIFETNPEALFGGPSTLVTNTGTTNGDGYVAFFDYAGNLGGPATTTGGRGDLTYMTIVDADASDVVLALAELNPPPPATSVYSDGDGTTPTNLCDDLDVGVILPHLDIDVLGTFNTDDLFGPSRCWDPENGVAGGPTGIPDNVWIPAQGVGGGFLCAIGQLAEAPWSTALDNTADTGVVEDITLAMVDAPLGDVLSALGADDVVSALLPSLTFRRLGFDLGETVAGDVAPASIATPDDYPNTFTVTYSGAPFEADVVGVSVGDYDGTNGIGPLFLLGTDIRPFTDAGTQVSMPNSDLDELGTPMGARRAAGLVALYLDPADADRTVAVGSSEENAVTAVYIRDDGAGAAPFGATGGTASLTGLGLSPFLDISSAAFSGPNTFQWENATNAGNVPLYSVHELSVVTSSFVPPVECPVGSGTFLPSEKRPERQVQWVVVKPFEANCGADECFDLPTLPASFPRAVPAAQQKSGFDQRVGSGDACGTCPVAGESCVDPDGGGSETSMCLGGSGTGADPYFTQEYEWIMHVYNLELRPGPFDFDDYDFDDRRMFMTHESSNRVGFD